MKAITIKQPWASLIIEGIKDIENRTWKTNFRGRVLIHAGACREPLPILLTTQQLAATTSYYASVDGMSRKPVSAIIGSVEIVDCVINHPSIWAEKTDVERVWANKTESFIPCGPIIYNWVLAKPIKFPEPIPCKGRLGFWDYEPDEKYFGCTNDNGYSNQSCGEKIGCPQNCSECHYNRFIYDKDI